MEQKEGFRDGLAIGLGYFSVSLAFGVLAAKNGLTWLEAALMSVCNLTSAGQYAALTVIAAGGSLIELFLTQLLINARYALMSISLSQKMTPDFFLRRRLLLGFGVTDEAFAVAIARKAITPRYFGCLIILPIVGWTAGTFTGTLLGSILPPPVTGALGLALYGMFVAIVLPVAKKDKKVLGVVVIAVAVSCLLHYVPPFDRITPGFAVILCTVIAAGLGAALFPIKEDA